MIEALCSRIEEPREHLHIKHERMGVLAFESRAVTTDAEGDQVHLLAAATHDKSMVLGRSRWAVRPTRCAARRPVVFPDSVRGTRSVGLIGFDGLPGAER